MTATAFRPGRYLLPNREIDLSRWAVVACDQYTSQPEYWQRVEEYVGIAPSTLQLMLPEIYLPESAERIPLIHQAMRCAMADGTLTETPVSFILIERTTQAGSRLGLLGCVDLEQYSYEAGAKAAIRPTEETVASRLPPRMAIRRKAPLELSHILLLADDPRHTLIEPLYAMKESLPLLYQTELMEEGGSIRGWLISDSHLPGIDGVLQELCAAHDGFLFAVGDGNHSLATAKACWEELKPRLTPEQRQSHPARFAMAEVVNIHDPALTFEPIHRLLTGVLPDHFLRDLLRITEPAAGTPDVVYIADGQRRPLVLKDRSRPLPVQAVQEWLDDWLFMHEGAKIDYIHGADAMLELTARSDAAGLLLPPVPKERFFALLGQLGVMPRKTFSLGEANEKRYYLECRRIHN